MVKKLKKNKSGFAGDVLKLATGSIISQVIPILATPFLTRLYGPDTWGVLAVFVSITAIFNVIACLRYELAIMLPQKEEEASNILVVSLLFPVIIAALIVPLVYFGQSSVIDILNAPGLSGYLWLIPAFVLIDGIYLALNYWNSRTRHYTRLAIARIITSIGTVSGKLGFGYSGHANAGTLMYATVGGQLLATTILGGQILRDDGKEIKKAISWKAMKEAMIRYRNFPIFSSWAALLNVISLQTPALLLSFYFSPAIVGFYAIGNRMLTKPLKFIGNSIAQVFYQRAAAAFADGTISELAGKTARNLALVGSFPMVLIAVLGPDLFSLIFGKQWHDAGIYAQILVPWTMIVFISSPLSSLNSILEKQAVGLLYNIVQLITRIISLVVGGITGNIFLGLALFSFSGVVLSVLFLGYHLRLCGVNLRSLGLDVLKTFVISFIFIAPVLILKQFFLHHMILFILITLLIIIGYYSFIITTNKELNQIVKKKLGKEVS